MAVAGMDYRKVISLASYIEETTIPNINKELDALVNSIPSKIAEVYGGAAAENTKARISAVAEKLNTDLNTIMNTLKSNAEEKQAAYATQEAKMQESVADSGAK